MCIRDSFRVWVYTDRPLPDARGGRYLGVMANETLELNVDQSLVQPSPFRFWKIVHLVAVVAASVVVIGAVALRDCSPERYGGEGSFKPGPLAYGGPWGLGNPLGVVAIVCVVVALFMVLSTAARGQRWWRGLAHLATAICIFLGHFLFGLTYIYDAPLCDWSQTFMVDDHGFLIIVGAISALLLERRSGAVS